MIHHMITHAKNNIYLLSKPLFIIVFLLISGMQMSVYAQTVEDPDGSVELANQVKNLYRAGN